MSVLFGALAVLASCYLVLLIARMVIGLIAAFSRDWTPRGVVLVICESVYSATDQPLRTLRRKIPPLRLGPIALDLSFTLLVIVVALLAQFLQHLSAAAK